MNNIKGLLLKDLLIFKSYIKVITVSSIFFALVIFLDTKQYNMFIYGPVIFLFFLGMNSISTFSYDEYDSTDRYLLALTVSKKDIVISKYLFTFLNSFLALLLGLFISIISNIIIGNSFELFGSSMKVLLLIFTGASFLLCCDIPCIYKWGVEKGRMQALLIPVFIVTILGFLGFIFVLLFPNLINDINLETIYNPLLCIIINIALYFISYKISYKIYEHKDI